MARSGRGTRGVPTPPMVRAYGTAEQHISPGRATVGCHGALTRLTYAKVGRFLLPKLKRTLSASQESIARVCQLKRAA